MATDAEIAAARAAAQARLEARCAPLTGGGVFTAAQAAACLTVPLPVPGAPAPAAPVPPNPATVAQLALTDMNLQPVGIGIVPENTPGKIGVVGAPVWMWANNPGEAVTGPMTRAATVAGVTVTATATLDRTVWTMGDGSSPVVCAGSRAGGTEYYDAAGLASSPTCGYRYKQPSDREPGLAYSVTATSYWTVNWNGGGGAGVIPVTLASQTQIQIGELQAIVTN